jgi:penicillin-insensitive murein DD-endopeptidase
MAASPRTALLACAAVALAAGGFLTALEVSGEQGRRGSTSVGNPNDGSLVNGAKLPAAGPGFYSNPARPNATAIFGTDEMIHTLTAAGASVEARAPGARLFVNDIGFRLGGTISHHGSHEAGRDADLLFYAFDASGAVADPVCVRFDGEGKARRTRRAARDGGVDDGLVFDDQRNWLVVRALVEDDEANVQRIFVAETLRARLLQYAATHDEPAWVVERAGDLMCEPETPHDDHFHVRIYCTAEDYRLGCRDTWPLFPWYRTALAALGLSDPQLRPPARSAPRSRAPVVSKRPPRPRPGRLWCP